MRKDVIILGVVLMLLISSGCIGRSQTTTSTPFNTAPITTTPTPTTIVPTTQALTITTTPPTTTTAPPTTTPEPVTAEEQKTKIEEVQETEAIEEPSDPNLIAHWKFDDDVKDSAGSNHGNIVGGAIFASGKIGKALYFDGIDDYVDFSQNTVNEIGSLSQGTIAFWFNYNSLLATQTLMPIFYIGIKDGNNNDNMYIIEIGHAAGTEAPYDPNVPEGTPDSNNKKIYSTWVKNNQEPFLCSDSSVNLGESKWHHYAMVSGPDGNTIYLNGVEITNRDYNFGHSSAQSFLDDIPVKEIFTLGYGRSSYMISPDFVYYKGYLDDVRIYDKPLNSEEIKELMHES